SGFSKNSKISMGVSFSFRQYRLNASELVLDQTDDPIIDYQNHFSYLPNAGAGLVIQNMYPNADILFMEWQLERCCLCFRGLVQCDPLMPVSCKDSGLLPGAHNSGILNKSVFILQTEQW
ncbi:MAG TPA: type IX secretion system membrane protein PorP/SprF, partial [Chromatiaceae bacterium]|nr:type IX secretion system membrane protein PorP/SprF [Chromatiaceae bacterium]